jgi:hemerythrin superfamily protein
MAQREGTMSGGRRSSQREWVTGPGSGGVWCRRIAEPAGNVIALLGRIEATDQAATYRRAAMLFQLKRMLTAHALAEEDVIYPMLHDDLQRAESAGRLYREHADMKMRLFELEHNAKDDASWIEDLRTLRRVVEEHTREEEQEEFPKLRAALGEARTADLLGEAQREKSMVL